MKRLNDKKATQCKYKGGKGPSDVIDSTDPFSIPNLLDSVNLGMYSSVAKDIEELRARRFQLLNPLLTFCPSLSSRLDSSPQSSTSKLCTHDPLNSQSNEVSELSDSQTCHLASQEIIDLDEECLVIDSFAAEKSKLVSKSFVEEMQEYHCKNVFPVNASHGSIHYMEEQNLENDLQDHNSQIITIDSDEEDSRDQIDTTQVSRDNPEASNYEVSEASRLEVPCDFGLDQRKGLTTHSVTSREVHDQHAHNKQALILDYDDEESKEQHVTTQASKYNPEALNFEVSQTSVLENSSISDSDLEDITYSDTAFRDVHRDQHQHGSMFIIALPVQDTVHNAYRRGCCHDREGLSKKPFEDFAGIEFRGRKALREEEKTLNSGIESEKDKGVYLGVQDDFVGEKTSSENDCDGLGDIWREMKLALECNKVSIGDNDKNSEDEEAQDCDHSFLLKDDLGYVCRVCGVIKKSIETIFDFQWGKGSKTTRTYMSDSQSKKEREENGASFFGVNGSYNLAVTDISVHPRHMKQMKPHQLEGFNFLVKNLISDNPGGCILAHAPGSGKTFMIISFVQSFLAKYPCARPLVILPKGILATWKTEFIKWQVEDLPLYDFYSSKAESRTDQLDILKEWVEHKGVLFLGYKQFANIVSKSASSKTAAACHDILLKVPTILILDEGHTPRNEDTDVLSSLAKVQTPRKVVLSGTLFQNHVKEVFNILNLVRPRFLKSDTSRAIRRRVMSRGQIGRMQIKACVDAAFFDVVEETLQHDEASNRKVAIIQDLREMTKNVLHYYKGDSLDELPGLVDYTVLLHLSPKQKRIVESLKKFEQFKRTSIGTSVYVHPLLKELAEKTTMAEKGCNIKEDKMNDLINRMDVRDGVKAKFFLNMLGLCESSGEKLLVFSQYLLPLNFLEMLVVNTMGWSIGKEIFMINGDTSADDREVLMDRFNNSPDAKVFFGSIKACGEGISLVGASRILIMDVHLNPSVTRQAIGRAFRPGQLRKVYVYRLVASDSPEEENYNTSFKKELISKMWFEWSEYCSNLYFDLETVNVKDSDDEFWQSPSLREDVNVVKKR
ncbi:Chromatin remodeling [Thalictrum thalictroides]|uniref:Chromatin remodeling n=1 Tax=Thalictrum thalictroides TaxID=46969 RepID=A0A7J6X588_THATH|nr:Chromatin remodeling [Thalictrum thalictroides]